MINQSTTPEEWNNSSLSWNSGDPWDQVTVINYKRESNSTLYTSGEYVVLGNTQPYLDVLKATGVQELFERQAAKLSKRKRGDIYKYITPDYYGLRDEEDGVLLILEDRAVAKYAAESQCQHSEVEASPEADTDSEDDDQTLFIGGITGTSTAISAHVAVPSQETIGTYNSLGRSDVVVY
jgi:hypothetical protein